MKHSKFVYVIYLFLTAMVVFFVSLLSSGQQETQAIGDLLLTPQFMPFVIKALPPTPTPTSTPVPTAVLPTHGDTFVSEGFANANFAGSELVDIGYHRDGCPDESRSDEVNRGLLKFNLPSTPAGAIITEAHLWIYLAGVCWVQDGPRDIKAYRIIENWTTTTVTWNNQPARSNLASGSTSIPINVNVPFTWYTLDITQLIRNWDNGTAPNYGLMLRAPEGSGNDFAWMAFSSSEHASLAPYLTITYSNGVTAVIALANILPDVDAKAAPTVSCGKTADGLSFCGVEPMLPSSTN